MREIDTDALLGVAQSLRVGNPATATRAVLFDDENLQQMWDASKFSRFPRLTASFGQVLNNVAANTTVRAQLSRSELFTQTEFNDELEELGLTPSTADVYLLGAQPLVELDNSANLDEMAWGFRAPQPGAAAGDTIIMGRATAVDGTLRLDNTQDWVTARNDVEPPDELPGFLPCKLVGSANSSDPDVLFVMQDSGAGGGLAVRIVWLLHFALKGLPLWYSPSAG